MLCLRLFSLGVIGGLILAFTSCEKHHPGELPELQQEHFHPLEEAKGETESAQPAAPATSVTPANFFPTPKP